MHYFSEGIFYLSGAAASSISTPKGSACAAPSSALCHGAKTHTRGVSRGTRPSRPEGKGLNSLTRPNPHFTACISPRTLLNPPPSCLVVQVQVPVAQFPKGRVFPAQFTWARAAIQASPGSRSGDKSNYCQAQNQL